MTSRKNCRAFVGSIVVTVVFLQVSCDAGNSQADFPQFERVQPELFQAPGGQPNAWADYDNDGDLDLFVGFRGAANRLYRNDGGTFTDVAREVGLADLEETRAASWGDIDLDGDLDLYVGFRLTPEKPNRLYLNEDNGGRFVDAAERYGVNLVGNTRQVSFVDYDGDEDVDLFIAFRDFPNRLFRNDDGVLVDVTTSTGVGDPRKTVGVAWFDMDADGDLDLFVANQNGDEDAFFRNDGEVFTDVAPELGMNQPNRGDEFGSVGPAVTDYDNDGDLDLFIATYGPDVLWSNQGDGTFVNVAPGTPLSEDYHSTTAMWGDVNNDGWQDLIVTSYLSGIAIVEDHLFQNWNGTFTNVTPPALLEHGPSHGVTWADFDMDGALDLAIANNDPEGGTHHLYRNLLAEETAARSLQVMVTGPNGVANRAGAEVRLYDSASGALLGSRLTDTGGGYCSQGVTPVHFGIPEGVVAVDVHVTAIVGKERRTTITESVAPTAYIGKWLTIEN